MREWATDLRTKAAQATRAHVSASAKLMGAALTKKEREALVQVSNVHDCIARRSIQWANVIEAAAMELEEP